MRIPLQTICLSDWHLQLIKYLRHTEIDQAKWDLCLEQSVNSIVYGYSWYLNVASPDWEALVLDDYVTVMPLTQHRKYFISYLSQPFFTQQLGVFSKQKISQENVLEFLNAIPEKFRFTDIQLNEQNQLAEITLPFRKRRNYVLDLNANYDKIVKGYGSQTNRNLKKARKNELLIRTLPFIKVVEFYQSHKSGLTKGVKKADYKRLISLLEKADEKRLVLPKGVYDSSGQLLAAAAFIAHKSRIIFLIGNGSDQGNEKGAMTYLMDNLIYQFSGFKMELDFEGSDREGIARFFKGFGAEKRTYLAYRKNNLPWILRLFKN